MVAVVETVDDLILELKPNGTFQILLTIAVCVLNAPAVISLWLTEFTATDLSWQCNENRYDFFYGKPLYNKPVLFA